jgi:hypothetical protein
VLVSVDGAGNDTSTFGAMTTPIDSRVGARTTFGIFGFGRVDDYTMEEPEPLAFGHGGGPRLVCTFILRVRVVRLVSAKDIASRATMHVHAANHHCS